jgi:hypothetical protein
MNDTRGARLWTLLSVCVLALTAGAASQFVLRHRETSATVAPAAEELRDAVASPMPPTAGLAGRPVPTKWFKTPEQKRAEMYAALLSSRRRRPAAQ